MTKDFTPPSIESKPMSAVMPSAPDSSFMGNYPLFPFAYPFGDRNPMFSTTFDNLQQQVYPTTAQRWPDYQEAKNWIDPIYPMNPFHIPHIPQEPYPTDPCPSTTPSTSVAQPQIDYKPLDYNMLRGNPMAPAAYYNGMIPYNDFASTQAITASWKAAVKGANPSKNGIPPTKHRTGPGTNNVRVRTSDTYRVVYTDAQRTELELEYQSQEFISADRKAELSARLNLTERQVKIWFQNRRAKKRRDSRNKNY